jgi:hypothetical protein
MATAKKGLIISVNEDNNQIGRLSTGEVVFGNKSLTLAKGKWVTYQETMKTQRYAKDENGNQISDGNGGFKLEADPNPRAQNQVLAVFDNLGELAKAAAAPKLAELEINAYARKEAIGVSQRYALTAEEEQAAVALGF